MCARVPPPSCPRHADVNLKLCCMNCDERGNVDDPDRCLKFINGFDEHDLLVLFLCEASPDTG